MPLIATNEEVDIDLLLLKKQIDEKRKQLAMVVQKNQNNLSSPEVVKFSQELDKIILEYFRIMKQI